MEDLTKQQMVLLTLLVSFVASIATSVSVVSLLNETPTTITQTVNRIVEKTIEKVVPTQVAQMLPTPTPLPPKEDLRLNENDLIIRAVEMNLSKMVVFQNEKGGLGFVISADGLMVTDQNVFDGRNTESSEVLLNGKIYEARKEYIDENSSIAILKLYEENGQSATGTPFVSFATEDLKLGASVVALGGKEGSFVYQGIISEQSKTHIVTSFSFKPTDTGGILFGTDGKILGMNTNAILGANKAYYTIRASSILSILETHQKGKTPTTP